MSDEMLETMARRVAALAMTTNCRDGIQLSNCEACVAAMLVQFAADIRLEASADQLHRVATIIASDPPRARL